MSVFEEKFHHVVFDGYGNISASHTFGEGDAHLDVVLGLTPLHLGGKGGERREGELQGGE